MPPLSAIFSPRVCSPLICTQTKKYINKKIMIMIMIMIIMMTMITIMMIMVTIIIIIIIIIIQWLRTGLNSTT